MNNFELKWHINNLLLCCNLWIQMCFRIWVFNVFRSMNHVFIFFFQFWDVIDVQHYIKVKYIACNDSIYIYCKMIFIKIQRKISLFLWCALLGSLLSNVPYSTLNCRHHVVHYIPCIYLYHNWKFVFLTIFI